MAKIAKLCPLLAGCLLGAPTAVLAQSDVSPRAIPTVLSSVTSGAESAAEPNPEPAPVHHDTERGEVNLGLGFSYLRFRSSPFNASTYGTNTNLTYFISPWLGIDGNVSTGFGPQSAGSAQARSVLYGVGVRVIRPEERQVRPWTHVLLGGIHMFPQTAFSNSGFAAQLGGGVDYRLRYWLWVRVEANYVRSQLYAGGQNNLQVASSVVYRF